MDKEGKILADSHGVIQVVMQQVVVVEYGGNEGSGRIS